METVGFSLKTVDKYLFLLLIINIEHRYLCGKLNQRNINRVSHDKEK